MQVKLLRVLQERKFVPVGGQREIKTNTRIVAATNRNLEKMIEDRNFREDLFYRLNVLPIFLPPLTERSDDIPALVEHFIKKIGKKHPNNIKGISTLAMEALKRYQWPGNIRELENLIERSFIVENSNEIQLTSLPEYVRDSLQVTPMNNSYEGPMDYDRFKEQVEKDFIVSALKVNKGKINQTVAHANIPKNTLLRKIKKYRIHPDDYKE